MKLYQNPIYFLSYSTLYDHHGAIFCHVEGLHDPPIHR